MAMMMMMMRLLIGENNLRNGERSVYRGFACRRRKKRNRGQGDLGNEGKMVEVGRIYGYAVVDFISLAGNFAGCVGNSCENAGFLFYHPAR